MRKKIYIIVGLFNNMEFLNEASNNPNIEVFAFEPNPFIIEDINNNYKLPCNYHIIQKAVSDLSGRGTFNICSNPTCSSLQKWGNGPTFGEMTEIEVDIITMYDFIEEYKIKEIEYLQIDTQGGDLKVLKGFKDKIKIVRTGQCESLAPHVEWKLYEDQPSYSEISEFLKSSEFTLKWEYNIGNGCPGDEVNIKFRNTRVGRQVGIMLMKDENDILEEYLEKVIEYYDTILVLDGTKNDDGREICKKFSEVVYYEKDWIATDEKPGDYLRGILYDKIKEICPEKTWVGILHPDEFPSISVLDLLSVVEQDPNVEVIMIKNVIYFPHISQRETWKFEMGDKIEPLMKWAMIPGWGEFRYFKFDPNLKYVKKHGAVLPYREKHYYCIYPEIYPFHHKHFTVRSYQQMIDRSKSRLDSEWNKWYESIINEDSMFFESFPTPYDNSAYPKKMW